jgi:hypothetical protein
MSAEPHPPASRRLFEPEELQLRPSTAMRLRALAGRGAPRLTERERRACEDREAMDRLRGWGVRLAREFELAWKSLEAERDGVTEHYGICYEDGVIRIRLRHALTGRLLKESSLVDTLCHELAHLRHLDHGPRFRRLYERILRRARELGLYRPGRTRTRPRQGSLFPDERCGAVARGERRGRRGDPV